MPLKSSRGEANVRSSVLQMTPGNPQFRSACPGDAPRCCDPAGVGESSSTDSSYSVGSERLDCCVVSRLSRPEHGSRSGDAGRGTKHRRADTCLRSIQTLVFGFEPCGSSPGGAVPAGLVGAQALPALSKCRVTNPNVEGALWIPFLYNRVSVLCSRPSTGGVVFTSKT